MEFENNRRAIYLQIADKIMDDIMAGLHPVEERIPSVREYAAMVEVNANTVMRAYDYLTREEIIFNRRGIGFFVKPGAQNVIAAMRKRMFFETEMPKHFTRLHAIGITPDELSSLFKQFLDSQK